MKTQDVELMVTMWPSFGHFDRFARDQRISGVRLNTAMIRASELDDTFRAATKKYKMPLYFDIKGRQLRVTRVDASLDHLEIELNHPIEVETPTMVLFKGGQDRCLLKEINGSKLIFDGGPKWMVYEGESLHIRHPSLKVLGPTFLNAEKEKIAIARQAGFEKFFLSYVETQDDVDEFRELVGHGSEIVLKIENLVGLKYVANDYRITDGTWLMAAMGDLYVELQRPHDVLGALKLIREKDENAGVGSRLLLSVVQEPVPSAADFMQLAWLRDIGYKKMMLCDEICLKESLLASAIGAFDAFRNS